MGHFGVALDKGRKIWSVKIKAFFLLVVVQVVLVLAKPYKEQFDSNAFGTFASLWRNAIKKRGASCGGDGCEPEGCYSRRCRSSCRNGERHITIYDNQCSGGKKCCMCHRGWRNGRVVES